MWYVKTRIYPSIWEVRDIDDKRAKIALKFKKVSIQLIIYSEIIIKKNYQKIAKSLSMESDELFLQENTREVIQNEKE